MRKLFIGLGALAVAGFALPAATPASAQDRTVIIKKDRAQYEGWRRHHAKVVIVKKHKRWHHDHD